MRLCLLVVMMWVCMKLFIFIVLFVFLGGRIFMVLLILGVLV